jgi:hypothetical protein
MKANAYQFKKQIMTWIANTTYEQNAKHDIRRVQYLFNTNQIERVESLLERAQYSNEQHYDQPAQLNILEGPVL